MRNEVVRKLLLILPLAALCVAVDLLTKHWAVESLRFAAPQVVIEGFWNHIYVQNTGMAWGIGKGWHMAFFLASNSAALAVLGYFMLKVPRRFMVIHTALALILGGAVGNMVDRVRQGYVVDFIDWHVKNYHWPTFNMADVFISVGVGLLLLTMLFGSGDPFGLAAKDAASTAKSTTPAEKDPAGGGARAGS